MEKAFIRLVRNVGARYFNDQILLFFEYHIITEEYFVSHLLIFQNRYETQSVLTYHGHT